MNDEVKMFDYITSRNFMSPKVNMSNHVLSRICYTPNSVFAMCRERGANIVKKIIPITWKKSFFK